MGRSRFERDDADVIHRERLRGLVRERADVGAMLDGGNERGHGVAGVLEQVAPIQFERR